MRYFGVWAFLIVFAQELTELAWVSRIKRAIRGEEDLDSKDKCCATTRKWDLSGSPIKIADLLLSKPA